MSLNLSHCREIGTSFESGPLGVHSNWDRKHRVPLTSVLLRENSSWAASGKLAHLFSQRQGISSHLLTIWGTWSFPRDAVLKLIFIWTWDCCLREFLYFPKGSQATCSVWCGTRDSYGQMKGKWASSRFNLEYTELFCIPEVTAVFLSSCDSGLGDSLVFHQAHWGALHI